MLAFVFPGQGSQAVGMAKAACEEFASARAVFAEADEVLGFSLSSLCFEGPEAELQLTTNSQPAILTASIAILRALEESTGKRPAVVAGHSLGEYSALVCAGAMAFADAVRSVRKRGQFMQEAVPPGVGSMAAIGASAADAQALCTDAAQGEVLSPANFNSSGQTVIAGHATAVARAVALAGERKIAAKELKVSAPFHCALMEPAAAKLREELSRVRFMDARIPVISNVDATAYTSDIAPRLVRQVTSPVRWEASVQELARRGVTTCIEVGAGRVLTQLLKRIDKSLTGVLCETPADIRAISN